MNYIIKQLENRSSLIRNNRELFNEIISFLAIIIFIVIPVRMYVAQPFRVSGESMINTFHDKDYLIVDEISYRFISPKRGDVIVLEHPDTDKFLIKRIIGLPTETVRLSGAQTTVINESNPDGFVLDEGFLDHPSRESSQEYTVPEGYYFVMGDNRPFSSDSRSWGLLPRENITGRALARLYPFDSISLFPGTIASYSAESNQE
jgi:signal peptidase I